MIQKEVTQKEVNHRAETLWWEEECELVEIVEELRGSGYTNEQIKAALDNLYFSPDDYINLFS